MSLSVKRFSLLGAMNEQDVFFYTRREAGRLTGEAEAKATDYLDGGGSAAPRSFSSSRARAASAGPVTAAAPAARWALALGWR